MARLWFSILIIAIATVVAFEAQSRPLAAEEHCNDSARDELECHMRVASRNELQLEKDFQWLSTLAVTRNTKSAIYFRMGQIAFRNFLQQNCESERHDAFGGSLEEVLEQKCRRNTLAVRRRLFELIAERHPFGLEAERSNGRSICASMGDLSNPLEVGAMANMGDVELLRKTLDGIGARAAFRGIYVPAVAKHLRAVHVEAEKQIALDASFTCLGIVEGFCPNFSKGRTDSGSSVRDEWLSRCQTQIRGAFYRRATTRLRMLKSQ